MTSDPSQGRYAWLEASAVRNASDMVLGALLLAVAVVVLVESRATFGSWAEPDAGFFPCVVGVLAVAVSAPLLLRGALGRAPHMRWSLWQVILVAVCATGASLAVWLPALASLVAWSLGAGGLLLLFGPAEWAALLLLLLAAAIALSRLSRLRAAAMVLLGLALQIVGLDAITGRLRLTMGLEPLLQGIDYLALAPGLILVADSIVCVFSPALLLATYARRIAGWRDPVVSTALAIVLRLAAVLVIAASCYLAFRIGERPSDVALLCLFGAVGVVSKVFAWNRLVLLLAFSYGLLLEESLRQAMLAWNGEITLVFQQPVSAGLLAAATAILVVALILSLRRVPPQSQAT